MASNNVLAFLFLATIVGTMVGCIDGHLTCHNVVSRIKPCLPYLTAKGPAFVAPTCCPAVQSLDRRAGHHKKDRVTVCECLRDLVLSGEYKFNVLNAMTLPSICHLKTVINPIIDCPK
ncbi:non-specific lipid-transfer protein 6-like [Impatiens glandulifera]|uniref:non-specific lipid-transfer protein 6-like n=1 Tax=Impatiens glandulifera TaxID=253017 RepID=UPI001FB11982|nr:non-specific lipid-transfer protein 6-like [Impatiens glandulifera]